MTAFKAEVEYIDWHDGEGKHVIARLELNEYTFADLLQQLKKYESLNVIRVVIKSWINHN